jgi:hypothetical protein
MPGKRLGRRHDCTSMVPLIANCSWPSTCQSKGPSTWRPGASQSVAAIQLLCQPWPHAYCQPRTAIERSVADSRYTGVRTRFRRGRFWPQDRHVRLSAAAPGRSRARWRPTAGPCAAASGLCSSFPPATISVEYREYRERFSGGEWRSPGGPPIISLRQWLPGSSPGCPL